MKHLLLTLIGLSTCVLNLKCENLNRHFSATLYGGIYINEQAWIIEPEITWTFHKYLGLSLGAELTRQYNQPSRQTLIEGNEAELSENDRNVGWVIFKPNLLFKSPSLWENKSQEIFLWLQASGGLSLACPFRNSLTYEIKKFNGCIGETVAYKTFNNTGLNWLYWNSRISLNMSIDRLLLSIGYGLSNLDYYSCRRDISLNSNTKFPVPQRGLSHSIFIAIGIKL